METRTYLLESNDNSKAVNIIRIIFGVICIILAISWIVFNISSVKSDGTIWITIVFLASFGVYQILAGAGKTTRFISISDDALVVKQNSVIPGVSLKAGMISKIEIHPLSIAFILSKGSRTILRFGISYPETIIPVKEAISEFASRNGILLENRDEEA